ncbi:LAMI_0C03730g1_1 [Lachancea mirantina]|uniref:LAMI_0C03730g1_1 n=1 Tax=Lachancea mirantina TaxID=1230905 RepID=A0A1G4J2I1_9SACH|nr:LAMI_0C03730g1_1 [Lachancea mirantina]
MTNNILQEWVHRVESSLEYTPDQDTLIDVVQELLAYHNELDLTAKVAAVKNIGFFMLDTRIDKKIRTKCAEMLEDVIENEVEMALIQELLRLLPKIRDDKLTKGGRRNTKENLSLKPKMGYSARDEDERQAWIQNGGKRSVSLFYVVLRNLAHSDISANLWWITPGILNVIDDTTDLVNVRLQGVTLLHTFLTCTIDMHCPSRFDFSKTGVFELFESSLTGMCYKFPGADSAEVICEVWNNVLPTLIELYRIQFWDSEQKYQNHLDKLLSDLLLQSMIPRVSSDYAQLSIIGLNYVRQILRTLGPASTLHIQRIIYTLGEYFVRNPFITLFPPLMHETLQTLQTAVEVCPNSRVSAHKYDLLAVIVILFEKCRAEGSLDDDITLRLRNFVKLLISCGCSWSSAELSLLQDRKLDVLALA